MIRVIIFIFFFHVELFCVQSENKIIVGAERINKYKSLISDKSIALLVNHTSMLKNTHLIDTLSNLKFNIQKIFSPEHGFKGLEERGNSIKDDTLIIDEKKIPIISMYGKNRNPSEESMIGIEAVIFDIQDVGARFYTYISAMHNMMKICAQLDIDFIVFDRPNPNGNYIDGPVLDMKYQSYVGMHKIPIVHGCTVGELAQMIKGEKWIEFSEKLNLIVIKVKNWDHNTIYKIPIRPSPNLPNQQSVLLYPSLCLFEQTIVSIGRGTDFPFQIIGHPNSSFKDFQFTPISVLEESKPKLEGQLSNGIDLRRIKVKNKLNIKYLIDFYHDLKDTNDDFFGEYFFRIAGNKTLENQIISGLSEEEIRLSWKNDIELYKKMRKKYLLYKDFE